MQGDGHRSTARPWESGVVRIEATDLRPEAGKNLDSQTEPLKGFNILGPAVSRPLETQIAAVSSLQGQAFNASVLEMRNVRRYCVAGETQVRSVADAIAEAYGRGESEH